MLKRRAHNQHSELFSRFQVESEICAAHWNSITPNPSNHIFMALSCWNRNRHSPNCCNGWKHTVVQQTVLLTRTKKPSFNSEKHPQTVICPSLKSRFVHQTIQRSVIHQSRSTLYWVVLGVVRAVHVSTQLPSSVFAWSTTSWLSCCCSQILLFHISTS